MPCQKGQWIFHGQPFLSSCLLAILTNSVHYFLKCPSSYGFPLSTMKAGAQAGFPVLRRATQKEQKYWGIQTTPTARYEQSVFPPIHTPNKYPDIILIHHTKSIASANTLFLPFSSALTMQKLILPRHKRDGLCMFSSSCSSINKLSFASLFIKRTLFSLTSLTDKLDGM